MEELINQLVTKAGLSEEQARNAVIVIKDYITAQLPPMMQPMVDNFLGQQNGKDDGIGE